MEENKQEFYVNDLYVVFVTPIKLNIFNQYRPIFRKSKFLIVKVIDGKIVDIMDKRQTSYRELDQCGESYLADHLNELYIYNHKKFIDFFKKYRFAVKITLEEIISLYFKLNNIQDEEIKKNIIENSTLLPKNECKTNDIVLNKILEIEDNIVDLDSEIKIKILSNLVSVANNYLESFVKSKFSEGISNSNDDIQLIYLQELSKIELKVYKLKNGQTIEPSEIISNLDKFIQKIKKK